MSQTSDRLSPSEPHQYSYCWAFTYVGETPHLASSEEIHCSEMTFPLTEAEMGRRVWIRALRTDAIALLSERGLILGTALEIVSKRPSGSVVVALEGQLLGLGAEIARKIAVSDRPQDKPRKAETAMRLQDMAVGMVGRAIGYERSRGGYRGKLISMGLTVGTEFIVMRVPPQGHPIEINVKGVTISLDKPEADALIVEEVSNNI